jgi:hypothetical protein
VAKAVMRLHFLLVPMMSTRATLISAAGMMISSGWALLENEVFAGCG